MAKFIEIDSFTFINVEKIREFCFFEKSVCILLDYNNFDSQKKRLEIGYIEGDDVDIEISEDEYKLLKDRIFKVIKGERI